MTDTPADAPPPKRSAKVQELLARRVWSPHRRAVITMAEATALDLESMATAAYAGKDPEDLSQWPTEEST